MKWILLDTNKHVNSEARKSGLDRSIAVACQFIILPTNTAIQVNYQLQENVIKYCAISCTVEPPINVGSGIYIQQKKQRSD